MTCRIEIIIGSMFSGKSTEMIRRCDRYKCIGQTTLIINHSFDTRCADNLVQTHNNITSEAVKVQKLFDVDEKLIADADVIGIDEAQFFEDLDNFIEYIERFNKVVIVAGLDGDFKRNKFGKILDIIPKADYITKLTAMCSFCKDGTSAIFSAKIEKDDKIIDVGAAEKYLPVCRKHYCYFAS